MIAGNVRRWRWVITIIIVAGNVDPGFGTIVAGTGS